MVSGKAFISIPTDTLIYVNVPNKTLFDALPGEEQYHEKSDPRFDLWSKHIDLGQGQVIFQHFPNQNGGA